MGSFFQNPLEWLSNEANRAGAAQYGAATGNQGMVDSALTTASGQRMDAPEGQLWGQQNKNPFMEMLEKSIQSSRPNVSSPFGSTNWTQDPTTGAWSMSQGFGGPLAGAASGLQAQLAQAFGSPMMTGDAARQQAIDAAYGQATSRLDPMWSQRESGLRTQLMNQGLDPASEAFQTEMDTFNRGRNDAYTSAMSNAIGQGTQAGAALFNQNMQARNAPLQSLQGMMGLLPGAPQGGGGNYLGALQAQMGQNQQGYRDFMDFLTGGVNLVSKFV